MTRLAASFGFSDRRGTFRLLPQILLSTNNVALKSEFEFSVVLIIIRDHACLSKVHPSLAPAAG
jgi:hypothetical protein